MSDIHVEINKRKIGVNYPPYIVAEISANHNGDINKAKALIKSASESGADAVKLQTYTPDTLTIDSDNDDFLIKDGLWEGRKLYDLYESAHTPFEWHYELFQYAKKLNITCFSSPFDETAVDLLESLNAPAYKIASFELIDLALIKYVAKTGKPIIMSTGMASLPEITEAVDMAKSNGCCELILLHCLSAYPAPISESNLRTIPDLSRHFNQVSGLSDHTLGLTAAITSIALGASFIEKHFTLDRNDKGPDSEFSIEPKELVALCSSGKDAWRSLGCAGYERKKSEESNLIFRRSLYFICDIKNGELITSENVRCIRPGFGIAPKYKEEIIGRKVNKDISKGTAVRWDEIDC